MERKRETKSGGSSLAGTLLTLGAAAAVGIGSYFLAKKLDESTAKATVGSKEEDKS